MAIKMPEQSGLNNANIFKSPLATSPAFSVIKAILSSGASLTGETADPTSTATPVETAGKYTLGADTNFNANPEFTKPEIPKLDSYDPIAQRVSALQSNPQTMLHQTLEALKNPTVPQEYKDAFAPPLLRAKIYGPQRGGLNGY